MINVSNEFRILMNQRTDFKQNAEITLADGTLLTLSEKDFTIANNSVVDGAGSNGIPLGVAICRNIQIELMNDDERFSEYDFFGAVIRLYLTFQLSESVERIEYGTFTVLTPSTAGTTVIITALDDMYKADKEYSTGLTFPTTVKTMWVDACNSIGIVPGTTSFNNDDFIVSAKPEGVTFRQALGYIAMIAGGNARIDLTGRMQIVSYDFSAISDAMNMISGGNFKKWDNEETIDGGDFTFAEVDEVIDGGNFTDKLPYHILGNWKDLTVDTDDITITGVSATVENEDGEEEALIYGSEGYMLSIENPLIIGNERLAVQLIGEIMVGGTFRQFSGDITANPLIEFMDTVLVIDRKMNLYPSFVTDINFQFFGFTSVKNSATPVLTNGNSYPTDATKTLVKARELINKERTAREAAVEQLAKDLANSSGLFMTQEAQSDGSIIYYMHDKPTLAESMIIWKLTALAFGISTDGGKTYPYGFTVDGTTITRLLYAEGIDADYINTGALRIEADYGEELFYADYNTKQVRINADAVLIGSEKIENYMKSLISIATDEIRLEVTERTSMYNEEVNTLQGGMDGSIDLTFFLYDTTPIITTLGGKQCINGGGIFYQDVSLPAGTYLFSYEWLRNLGLYINAHVQILDLSITAEGVAQEIYSEDLGYAWPESDVWTQERYRFSLEKTTRIRFQATFSPPSGYEDRTNSLYLTNIALYGTAQSVADAISDMKAELIIQSDQISSKVSRDNIISEINQTAESITIKAEKIDLMGLVNANEFTAKYASLETLYANSAYLQNLIIQEVSAVNASVQNLSANKADVSSLNALSASVDSLSANKLDVSQFTASNISALGITVDSARVNGGFHASKITSGTISANRLDIDGIINSNTFKGSAITVQALYALSGITVNGKACAWKTANVRSSSGSVITIKYLGEN